METKETDVFAAPANVVPFRAGYAGNHTIVRGGAATPKPCYLTLFLNCERTARFLLARMKVHHVADVGRRNVRDVLREGWNCSDRAARREAAN